MAHPEAEKLIFGRYSREECGLPPRGAERWRTRMSPATIVLLAAVAAAAAWLGGEAVARWRDDWVALLPSRVMVADLDQIPHLLEQGRLYATALPHNQRMRRNLAVAAVTAGDRMPRRLGYYATAASLFRGMDGKAIPDGAERFGTELTAAGVYAEVDDYPSAFAALNRAEKALSALPEEARRSFRLPLVNAQAYFLAVADRAEGGDRKKAAELAALLVSSRDPLPGGGYASGSAAILDTVAAAWHGVGDTEQAVAAQTLALGLAGGDGLDVYLKHYDEFSKTE